MKLRGWHINGWGHFHNHTQEDLSEGLNIFHGPNEAGKSTQLEFIRQVLFGFPTGSSKTPRYEPLGGGTHGGTLLLDSGGRPFQVQRIHGRKDAEVLLPDGRTGGSADLAPLLLGTDRKLFENVFAFSLTELQDLGSLHAVDVRDRLFSTGIAGAGASARAVIANLESLQGSLMRNRSKDAEVNGLLDRLKRLERELHEAVRKAEQFGELRDRLEEVNGRLAAYDADHKRRDLERDRYRLLIELWEEEAARQETQETLDSLEKVDSFPAKGPERLVECRERRLAVDRDLRSVTDQVEALEREKSRLETECNDTLFERRSTLRAVVENVGKRRADAEQLTRLESEIRTCEVQVSNRLQKLGPNYQPDDVRSLDMSRQARQRIEEWQKSLADRAQDAEGRRHALEDATRHVAATQRRLEDLQGNHGPEGGSGVDALADEDHDANLAGLDRALLELRRQEAALDAVRANLASAQEGAPTASPGRILPAAVVFALVVAAVFALVGGVVLAAASSVLAAVVVCLLGVIALVGAAFAFVTRRASLERRDKQEAHQAAVGRAEASVQACEERVAAAREKASHAATAAGLPSDAMEAELRRARDQHSARKAERRLTAHHDERLREVAVELRQAHDAAEAASTAVEIADKAVREICAEWEAWREERNLPHGMNPAQALAFLEDAADALEVLGARDRLDADQDAIRAACSHWDAQAMEVLDGLADVEPTAPLDLVVATLRTLLDRLEHEEATRKRLTALPAELAAAHSVREGMQAALDAAETAYQELLEEAEAEDEAAFHRRHETYERRKELRRTLDAIEATLNRRIGRGEEAQALRDELASGDITGWTKRKDELTHELEQANEALKAQYEERANLQHTLRELESSADVATREFEIEALKTELEAALQRWTVLDIARDLVERTLQTYVLEKQPAVLRHASEIFETVTGGRYDRIVQTEALDAVVVIEKHSGRRKSSDQLSRGTVEQLYLSLRLGFAKHFAAETVELPIVIDDVLVNFDPARAAAMAEAIAEVAQGHQVLFFTCHEHLVEMLRAASPEAKLIELGDAPLLTPTLVAS